MALAVCVPDTLEVIVGEQLALQIDFTNLMSPGDVLSSPTVTVTSLQVDETVPSAIIGSPFLSGTAIMNVTVSSAPLRVQNIYVLMLNFVATSGGSYVKTISAQLMIKVIY